MSEETHATFEGWAIVELMGHRRLGGYVRQEELFGRAFMRVDVPGPDDCRLATQYYGPESIYCLTPTIEPIARAVAERNVPTAAHRWELPAPQAVMLHDEPPNPDDEAYGLDDDEDAER